MTSGNVLLAAFRSLKITPELRAVGTQIDDFVARLGKTPFTNIANKVTKTDLATTSSIHIPELNKTVQLNKPLDLLKELEGEPANLQNPRLKQAVSNSIATIKKGFEDQTPKVFLKDISFKLENVPSDEELLDPTKFKKREINWEWFRSKGLSEEEISKLQSTVQEQLSPERIKANQQKLDEEILAVAKKFDGVVQDLFASWFFQPGNVSKLVERSAEREAAMRFYLTASASQILERHPDWNEKINQDIMESKWAAFEDPADPQWELKDSFVPKYPREVRREHNAHGGGHH